MRLGRSADRCRTETRTKVHGRGSPGGRGHVSFRQPDRGSCGCLACRLCPGRRHPEDRRGQRDQRCAGRRRALHGQRPQAGARRDQQGRRRAGPADGVADRGQRQHEPRHGARVLQARERRRAGRHRRSDPQHADPGDRAEHREGGHPHDDRRQRTGPHAHEQPLGVPGAPERQLFVARDRGFRREHAEAAQVGHRALHGRVRHRRQEGARGRAQDPGRGARADPGLHQQLAGLHAHRAGHQEIRRGRDSVRT